MSRYVKCQEMLSSILDILHGYWPTFGDWPWHFMPGGIASVIYFNSNFEVRRGSRPLLGMGCSSSPFVLYIERTGPTFIPRESKLCFNISLTVNLDPHFKCTYIHRLQIHIDRLASLSYRHDSNSISIFNPAQNGVEWIIQDFISKLGIRLQFNATQF